jgi:sensor domain CHASE-containing protein
MLKRLLSIDRANRPFIHGVLLPVVLVAVTTLALGAAAILWAVNKSNDISAERQLQTMLRSIKGIVQELALQQETVAIWDEPVLHLRADKPDPEWLDGSIGIWLQRTFGHDQVFVLDAAGNPVYAALGGTRADPSSFEALKPILQPHLLELREREQPPAPAKSRHLRTAPT